jgi:hypothetical protein
MNNPDAQQYERLVGRLVNEIRKRVPTLVGSTLQVGSKCHIDGASGFSHQIDVGVQAPKHIVLVECKHWNKRIRVREVLVLVARQADIYAANPTSRVEALFATKIGASTGARRLAEYFAVDVGVVSSELEFALRIASHVSVGVSDGAIASDSADNVIVRGGKRIS